jgi:hypothetical protein
MTNTTNTVYTMVVLAGASDALQLSEDHRKHFATLRAARNHARYRVTKAGGWHAAIVLRGTPSDPLAEVVASYDSAARRRFLGRIAAGFILVTC